MKDFENIQREAYREWLHKMAPDEAIAITITFKQSRNGRRVKDEDARSAVHQYSKVLNLKAYGNAFKRRERQLTFIPVREGGTCPSEKHLHYHLMVQVPETWTTAAWIDLAEKKLRTIECFGDQFVVKPVRDSGWLQYILKDRDKKSFDEAVDVENLWVN